MEELEHQPRLKRKDRHKRRTRKLIFRSMGCGLIVMVLGAAYWLGNERFEANNSSPEVSSVSMMDKVERDERHRLPIEDDLVLDKSIDVPLENGGTSITENMAEEIPSPAPLVYTKSYNDGSNHVYLTIDDGPSASTEALLDVLEAYDVKATFFMLEPNMERYKESVIRLVQAGHMPGMHGVTHRKEKFYADSNSVLWEMLYGQEFIHQTTGKYTPLIRVPYGSKPYMIDEYVEAVVNQGLSMWDWNVDSLDWKFRSEEYVTHTIAQVERLKTKGETPVILIHDTPKTVEYLPKLLDYLLENGYKFVLIDAQTEPVQFPR